MADNKVIRLQFRDLGKMKWMNIPIITGVILIISDLFNWLSNVDNSSWSSPIVMGQLLIYITILWMVAPYLVKKNIVQWNDKGMNLKINSLLGHNIPFSDIKEAEIKDNALRISRLNGTEYILNVAHLHQDDLSKLMDVITTRIR